MMYNFFILLLTLSVGFTNQVYEISGDINSFASMNTGSLLDNNLKNIHTPHNMIYSSSFIRYPADVNFIELFVQKNTANYYISTQIGLLDYGVLSNINNNKFLASDKILELSIFKKNLYKLTIGASVAYSWSNIGDYKSSLILGNICISKSLFDNHLQLGFSLENINYILSDYSNINEQHQPRKKLSIKLIPEYLPIDLLADYIYYDTYNSELSFSIKGNIYNNFHIYLGKDIYLASNENTIFDNIASGVGVVLKHYKVDIGFQYTTDVVFSFGTSLIIFIK